MDLLPKRRASSFRGPAIKPINVSQVVHALAASRCCAACKSRGSIVTILIEETMRLRWHQDHCRDTAIDREGQSLDHFLVRDRLMVFAGR
jgi:hypothetical protein